MRRGPNGPKLEKETTLGIVRWTRVTDAELRTDEPLDVLVEGLHKTRKNRLKNDLHDRLARGRDAKHVVVPREARGYY